MRFQVSCAPTHVKFLVDSNLNKSVLINLIMENHHGECLEDPSGFPTRLLSPMCTRFIDSTKHWSPGLVLRQSKKINSQNQPMRRNFGKLLFGVKRNIYVQ